MCLLLNINKKKTKEEYVPFDGKADIIKKLNKQKEVTCWKIYNKKSKSLLSVTMCHIIKKPGLIVSDREQKDLYEYEKEMGNVFTGIHVYTKCPSNTRSCPLYHGQVIVPVICRKADLIAQADDEAVFMKVSIRSRAWKKIFPVKKENK